MALKIVYKEKRILGTTLDMYFPLQNQVMPELLNFIVIVFILFYLFSLPL